MPIDLGVGIFLAILLIELLIIVKAGLHIQGVITGMLLFSFLIKTRFSFLQKGCHALSSVWVISAPG